jgi:hypothetical protein
MHFLEKSYGQAVGFRFSGGLRSQDAKSEERLFFEKELQRIFQGF